MNQPTTHCCYCHTTMCKGCQTNLTIHPQRGITVMEFGKPPFGSQKDDRHTGGYKYLY